MKKLKFIMTLMLMLLLTGCFEDNTMDNIEIATSAYPIKYVVDILYGNHAKTASIYPMDSNINNFKITDVSLEQYSKNDMFIFNGMTDEKKYIKTMLKNNKDLKIIDVTSNMIIDSSIEELWLDPNNLLTIANNIKKGFKEYIKQSYLIKDIENNYKELKVDLTSIDAKYRKALNNSKKTIVVSSNMFLYLKKYGINVISLEEGDTLLAKDISIVKNLINNGEIKYIYILKGVEANDTIKGLIDNKEIELIELHTLSNLDDDEYDKYDYISLQNQNLENLKLGVY